MLTITYVSSLGHRGPKNTRVSFGPLTDQGARPWAWIPNEALTSVVPGTRVNAETVSMFGLIESTWTDKDGVTHEKRVPTQQVRLSGKIVFDAPGAEELAPATFITTDQGAAYAEATRAKANDTNLGADPF